MGGFQTNKLLLNGPNDAVDACTHSDRVRRSSSLCLAHHHALSGLGGPWFVIVELIALNPYTHSLPRVNVHALGRRGIKQFVRSRDVFRIGLQGFIRWKPEVGAFSWVA